MEWKAHQSVGVLRLEASVVKNLVMVEKLAQAFLLFTDKKMVGKLSSGLLGASPIVKRFLPRRGKKLGDLGRHIGLFS